LVRNDDVYILDGRTNRGRQLRLVFQDKGNGCARLFTGWDLKGKNKGKIRLLHDHVVLRFFELS
jgi:hypothetical protein